MKLIFTAPASTMRILGDFSDEQNEQFDKTRREVERLMGASNPTVQIPRMSTEIDFGVSIRYDRGFVINMVTAIGAAAARQGVHVAVMDLKLMDVLALLYANVFYADGSELSTTSKAPLPVRLFWAMFTALDSGKTQVELVLDAAERSWLENQK